MNYEARRSCLENLVSQTDTNVPWFVAKTDKLQTKLLYCRYQYWVAYAWYKFFHGSIQTASRGIRLFLNLLSNLVSTLTLKKLFVVLKYFPPSLKFLEQLRNCLLILNYCIHWTWLNIQASILNNVIEQPVNKILCLSQCRLQYFSRTQHRPTRVVLHLCCTHYVACIMYMYCNNYFASLINVVDYSLSFSMFSKFFFEKMCYTTISKKCSSYTWSKLQVSQSDKTPLENFKLTGNPAISNVSM